MFMTFHHLPTPTRSSKILKVTRMRGVQICKYCKITYFRVGVIIAKIKPANMKIFKGFSIATLPKT
jgi:hypothetical protein